MLAGRCWRTVACSVAWVVAVQGCMRCVVSTCGVAARLLAAELLLPHAPRTDCASASRLRHTALHPRAHAPALASTVISLSRGVAYQQRNAIR